MTFYQGVHRSQFDGSTWAASNCLPASVANGLRSTTAGKVDLSGAQVRATVARSEETNPITPGWSLEDAVRGVSRIPGAPALVIRSGSFADMEARRRAGYFIVCFGDSDRFPDGTCSGTFDGDHAVGLHPNGAIVLGDPICAAWRTETPAIIRAYAEKLAGGPLLIWAEFVVPVPLVSVAAPSPRYRLVIAAGTTTIATASLSSAGCIAGWVTRPWSGNASSAPCRAPLIRRGCSAGRATVALVTAGVFAGKHVRIAGGVSVRAI